MVYPAKMDNASTVVLGLSAPRAIPVSPVSADRLTARALAARPDVSVARQAACLTPALASPVRQANSVTTVSAKTAAPTSAVIWTRSVETVNASKIYALGSTAQMVSAALTGSAMTSATNVQRARRVSKESVARTHA